ncbi:MAG TPA: hypothetical protein VNG13_05760 [Mycobacteriales bacterium]|nr:hypothetical protein [Mycobacteriales bacterium]
MGRVQLTAGVLTAVVAAVLAPVALAGTGLPHSTGGQALPPAPGVGISRNFDAEPGLAIDGGGTVWIAGDISPNETTDARSSGKLLTGEDVWRSTDGGRHFSWVASPLSTLARKNPGLGGEDTDMAAATVKNSAGFYNVYAVSLWLGATAIAYSQDGGRTWSVQYLGGVPAQDRPWVAASGACTVDLLYHQLPAFEPVLNTYNLCSPTSDTIGASIDPVSSAVVFEDQVAGNSFNKLVVDNSPRSRTRGNIYVPLDLCDAGGSPVTVAQETATSCAKTTHAVGVSSDGGRIFHVHLVAPSPDPALPVWGSTVGVDAAGTVYFAWEGKDQTYLSSSRNGGTTWSAPRRVNLPPARTTVYPTVAGGAAGQVSLAWYGTNATGGHDQAARMGKPGSAHGAAWYVFLATSTDSGRTWHQDRMTGVIHLGLVCTGGSTCNGLDGDRNLYDDFGVAISPRTGLTSIAYTSDGGHAAQDASFVGYVSERCRLGAAGCRPG